VFNDGNIHLATVRWLPQLEAANAKPRLFRSTGVSIPASSPTLSKPAAKSKPPSAMILSSVLRLMLRFLRFSLRADTSTYQSGDSKAYHGTITKRGRAQARWLLTEAAEHMAKSPGPLRAFYQRINRKRGHNVAIIALARKMAELDFGRSRKRADTRVKWQRSEA
jgi:Transposase IS116/IS110/IS902 family